MGRRGRSGAALVVTLTGLVWSARAYAQCAADSDCRGGRVCQSGACIEPRCAKDVDCPEPQICEAGACKSFESGGAAAPLPEAAAPPDGAPQAAPPAALATAPPPQAVALAPAPSPDAPTGERETIRPLWITGLAVFASVYLISIPAAAGIAAAFESDNPGAHAGIMAIPLAGPWLEIGGVIDEEAKAGTPGFVVVGILQAAGAAMTIVGLTVRRDASAAARSQPLFAIAPVRGRGASVMLGGPLDASWGAE